MDFDIIQGIAKVVVGHGALGAISAVALYIAYQKDKQLRELYERMLAREETRARRDREMFSEMSRTVGALTEHTREP